MQQSLDAVALADNAASEQSLPMTFVDHAELIWRKLAEPKITQQVVADEIGWTRAQVSQYAALEKLSQDAWATIATATRASTLQQAGEGVAESATVVAFTEGLLRPILPLTPDQQFSLVRSLAAGEIDKKRFKRLAETFRDRNVMVARWIELAEVAKAKPRQVDEVSRGGRGKKGGVADAAREIGVSEPDARRAKIVASLFRGPKPSGRLAHFPRAPTKTPVSTMPTNPITVTAVEPTSVSRTWSPRENPQRRKPLKINTAPTKPQ